MLLKKLMNRWVDKEKILMDLNIKTATFYKYIEFIKEAGFTVKNKKGKYRVIAFSEDLILSKNDEKIFADLILLAKHYFPKNKSEIFKGCILDILEHSNKNTYSTVENIQKPKNKLQKPLLKPPKNRIQDMPDEEFEKEIIFELYGKLANSYILKDNERIVDKFADKIVIANSSLDKEGLFKRLLRYDIFCKVLFSKDDREEFKKFVQNSIKSIIR